MMAETQLHLTLNIQLRNIGLK